MTAGETQAERTDLAWQRTGLGLLAVAGLLGHRAVVGDRPVVLALAGITALLGLGVLGVLGPLRYRRLRDGTLGAAHGPAALTTAAVVLVAVGAAVAIVMPG